MTEEEFEHANREYDALPGTPPDGWSFRTAAEVEGREREVIREMCQMHEPEFTFARVTDTREPYVKPGIPEGIWVEVWKTPPHKQAPFNPPMQLVAPTDEGPSR